MVLIQEERGHTLVTTGPYRFIRHPGYTAALLLTVCSPIALGSYWAVISVLPIFALLVRRIWIEDRFPNVHLAGYRSYTRQVPYRIIPGVW